MKSEDQIHETLRTIIDHLKMEGFDHDEALRVLDRAKDLVGYLYHGRRPYRRRQRSGAQTTPSSVES